MNSRIISHLAGLGLCALSIAGAEVGPLFQANEDIGKPGKAGSATYNAEQKAYTVIGGGSNMWFRADALHMAWTKVSGDVALAADIEFPEAGTDPHRKACLIFRQSLDADSAYADAALHGDGLTSLQYRESKEEVTREIQANVRGPKRLRLEKRGEYVSMQVANVGEALSPAGGSFRITFKDPFYVGLAVCSHNDNVLEKARFTNLQIETQFKTNARPMLMSTLETVVIASKDRRVTWWTTNRIEAPNWSRDGQLYFNSGGKIFRVPSQGGTPVVVDTGFAQRNNNDHGISPDGTQLVISDQSHADRKSRIYTLPIAGGTPSLVTSNAPSYWHGWSPDGKTLTYCAERNGEYDVYTIPVGGGPETRLTTAKGLDDGPEYSPDGKYIYFNSDRTGTMHIWRMNADGTDQVQITKDELNNWFAHPSPDGKWLVILSYPSDVKGHPENKDVMLRLMSLSDGKMDVLAKLFGGQGTINVPSWSPDSRRLAFVSYQLIP